MVVWNGGVGCWHGVMVRCTVPIRIHSIRSPPPPPNHHPVRSFAYLGIVRGIAGIKTSFLICPWGLPRRRKHGIVWALGPRFLDQDSMIVGQWQWERAFGSWG